MSELKELRRILSNNEFLNNSNTLNQVIQRIFAALESFGVSLQGIAQEFQTSGNLINICFCSNDCFEKNRKVTI